MDVLAKHVFRIDPDRGEVVFLQSASSDSGRRLPVTFQDNVPWVKAQIAGIDEPRLFMVDTGCIPGGGTGLIQAETFETLSIQGKIKPDGRTLGHSLSGMTQRRRGRVGELSVGNYRHIELIFNTSVRNILGVNYWSRYVATFDFSHATTERRQGHRTSAGHESLVKSLRALRTKGVEKTQALDELIAAVVPIVHSA
jgi:hypothetical protein